MPSSLPSPSDDYAAPPDMSLSRAAWDAALTSVGARLRALEGISSDWEALIAAGTGQALEMIGANVEPQLAALSTTLSSLQTEVNAVHDVVAQINSGSVSATAVSETAGRIWLTPALRDTWNARPTTAAVEALISAAVAALIGGATPATLDTLAEIAAALGNDANLAATLTASIALKADVAALASLAPLDSPDFEGTPTAPTPGAAENNTRIATTAWVLARLAALNVVPAKLSTASGAAPSYSARAWVNFNGTGTPTIRASGNVSSITDNGTGDYTINFTVALPDNNYAVNVTSSTSDNNATVFVRTTTAYTASAVRIGTVYYAGSPAATVVDRSDIFVTVVR